jgi:hypothetical protein
MPVSFHLAHAQRIAPPLPAAPAEVETRELPQPVKAKAAGHDRVAGKVALEEPQVRRDVELGHHMPLAMRAAITRDIGDPVHHQHGRLGKLRVAGTKKLAPRAFEQVVLVEPAGIICHAKRPFPVVILARFIPSSTRAWPLARPRADGRTGAKPAKLFEIPPGARLYYNSGI